MDKIEKLNKAHLLNIDICNNISKKKFKNLDSWILFQSSSFKTENINTKKLKFKSYKRGSIVFIDFGIGIGSELSGKHFAIVLSKNDNPKNSKLTVLPLSSKNNNGNNIPLNKELIDLTFQDLIILKFKLSQFYTNIKIAIDTKQDNLKFEDKTQSNIFKNIHKIAKKHFNKVEDEDGSFYLTKEETFQIIQLANEQIDYLIDFYNNFNKNSYAVIDNITTISKFKTNKPINEFDNLNSLQISDELLNIIDEMIIKKLTK